MSHSFQRDMSLSRAYLPQMKQIIAQYLIVEAPLDEDMTHNTDLVVLRLEAVRIACRVRRHQYVDRFGDEFTVRSERPNGTKTELAKIIEGWGDYILYGFENTDGTDLCAWVLGDLKVFRLWFMRKLYNLPDRAMPGERQSNSDRSSGFRAFKIDDLPPEFVVARRVFAPATFSFAPTG